MTDALARLQGALADRYLIERELGQGGMATVYLAHDLKHDRAVALKVLRPELAATLGPERFHREIQIAAQLQHPNILPLLDSGEAAGFLYYAMPFVEGHSLRERLAKEGELPVPEAARILRDVADALSAAHVKGVVHRDIKPENVLLTGRHALVADFGVAKAVSEATGRQTLTMAGVALGTPTYMAPEQAAASPHVDHRADIYAFGVMAYEMLTGRPPFSAPTPQALLAAHVTEPPLEVTQRRATIPGPLAQLIMRCLAKMAADRPQTAEELLPVLETYTTPSGGITPTQTAPVEAVRRLPRWVPWAGGVVALAVVALVVSVILRPKPLNITISDITPVTTEPGVEYQPAISPDGKEVAYVAGDIVTGGTHLVIRSTVGVAGGGEAHASDTSLRSAWSPSWSPDGDFVRFSACRSGGCTWSETGKLGGAVQPAKLPRRALTKPAWAPDGHRVAFVVGDSIFVSSSSDSVGRRVATSPTGYSQLHSLAWSPDSRTVAYVEGNPEWRYGGNVSPSSIWIVGADGGSPREVVGKDFLSVSPAWLDARHLLFVSNRDGPRGLYVVEVGSQGRRGEPRAIPGVADPHSISYSMSSRTLAYSRFTLRQNVWAYPLGRSAAISIRDGRPVTSGSQVIETHYLSPDGRWLVFDNNRRKDMDLYKMPSGGGNAVSLTSLPGDEFQPRWSPDGREIVFYTGDQTIQVMSAEGGAPSTLTRSPAGKWSNFPSWSPNGLAIAFQSDRTGPFQVWLMTRDSVGGAWRDPLPLGDVRCQVPVWAPDGTGVMCTAPRGDLVLLSPQGRVLWRRNLVPGSGLAGFGLPAYSRDGRTIYLWGEHRDGRRGVWAVPVAGGAPRLIVVMDDPNLGFPDYVCPDVGPDRLYLTVSEYESDIWVAKLRY